MDALLIVVIVVAVLMGLIGLGVVAGSGRTRRMDERRIHAEELRREADFHDARAEQAHGGGGGERGARPPLRAPPRGRGGAARGGPGGLARASAGAARRA